MNFDMVVRRLLLCVLALILSLATSATAQMPGVEETSQSGGTAPSPATTASPDDGWHFGVTPTSGLRECTPLSARWVTKSTCTLRSETYFRT
jgi:hypothetical protein